MPIRVVKLNVKRPQALQNGQADAAGRNRTDVHRFEIIGARHAVRDVPAPVDYPLIRRNVVAYQQQDHHHHMLGYADAIAISNSATVTPCLMAAWRSTWSDPIPAVIASFSFFAFAILSAVR